MCNDAVIWELYDHCPLGPETLPVLMQQPSVMPPRRVFTSAPKLDEEARRRSEAATQQLMQNYNGQPNVGIKLMSKMGYGVAGELCSVWHVTIYHTVTSHQLPDGFGN